jgi:hypothetical protein
MAAKKSVDQVCSVLFLRTVFSISVVLLCRRFLPDQQSVGNLDIEERRCPRRAEKILGPLLLARLTILTASARSFGGHRTGSIVVSSICILILGQHYQTRESDNFRGWLEALEFESTPVQYS